MAQEIVRVSSYGCGEEALELGLQLGRKDMHSFHSSSLSFGIAFCVCEPKGGQRMRASGCQIPGVETPRGTNGLDPTN